MPQKVFTAKNGAKYIKLANGRCRFVKGGKVKKKGAGMKLGGAHKKGAGMYRKGAGMGKAVMY